MECPSIWRIHGGGRAVIHEYPKAWLYYWKDDGSYALEPRSFGNNMHTHDIYVVAEMLHRGAPRARRGRRGRTTPSAPSTWRRTAREGDALSPKPGTDWVAKFLHAGALLARRDAVDAGLLERDAQGNLVLRRSPLRSGTATSPT